MADVIARITVKGDRQISDRLKRIQQMKGVLNIKKEMAQIEGIVKESWERHVNKTYIVRKSLGFDTTGQLAKCLRAIVRENSISFYMAPIYHVTQTTMYAGVSNNKDTDKAFNQMLPKGLKMKNMGSTTNVYEYGQHIRNGFGPSQAGRYDPCVDKKIFVVAPDPETGQVGTHPGVSKQKFFVPMMTSINKEVQPKIRQLLADGVSRSIRRSIRR